MGLGLEWRRERCLRSRCLKEALALFLLSIVALL